MVLNTLDSYYSSDRRRGNGNIDVYKDTQALFNTIEAVENQEKTNVELLQKLNTTIELFKSNNEWKIKT